MKNKELLPCPFCGGEAEVVNILWLEDCFLTCKGCGIVTPSYDTEKEAINAWNTRTNTIPVGNGQDYEVTNYGS